MSPWWASWVQTLISVAAGALITWGVSRRYYIQAGRELRAEAMELRGLMELMLRGMQDAGWVKLNYDDQGRIIGFVPLLSGTAILSVKAEGRLSEAEERPEVIQPPPKEK
jgi:hypothetical protein